MATLLEAVGNTVDPRHPARTRARLELTLETLLVDRVIAAWQYDHWDEAHMDRQGWVDYWRGTLYDGGHVFPFARIMKDSLEWLDRYLGPVK